VDVAVVGAGQAGLSGAYFLRRAGFAPGPGFTTQFGQSPSFVVFDHAPRAGGAWQFRWPTLTLSRTHRVHDLPGMPLGEADASRPAAEVVAEYFARYERAFGLDVQRPVDVRAVRNGPGGRLLVETSAGTWAARALINATGTWDRPFWPRYPGQETFRGRQLHSADYRGPHEFAGLRVVVVGGGNSAAQQLAEVSEVAAATTWVTRRPPVFREGPFDESAGRAAVAMVEERVRRGLPPRSVVSVTGLAVTPTVARARERGVMRALPVFDRIVPDGVVWDGGAGDGGVEGTGAGDGGMGDGGTRFVAADVILWATGFRAAIDHLAPLRLREPGGGIRLDGTRAVADPRVHLVGYGPSASTIGANRAGRAAVREIRALLAAAPEAVPAGA
jgi:cation diffusion facilitator CzcD-associated flavoprotein CzcO